MLQFIAITAGVVLGLFGLGVVGVCWWMGRALKGLEWDTW